MGIKKYIKKIPMAKAIYHRLIVRNNGIREWMFQDNLKSKSTFFLHEEWIKKWYPASTGLLENHGYSLKILPSDLSNELKE